MIRKVFIMALTLAILLSAFVLVRGQQRLLSEGIIYPGKGVDEIQIGESPPQKRPCGGKGDVEVECVEGRVSAITVRSRYFYLVRTRVRVGSEITDVLRFYGEGEQEVDNITDKFSLKYRGQGVDFEISKSSRQITGIRVYHRTLPKSLR